MGKKDKSERFGNQKPITDDSRFASVHNDPRFKLPNLKNTKIKVDERFSKKELEKLNAGSSGKKVTIDKYGRKIKGKVNDIDKYYEHESDEEDESSEDEKAEMNKNEDDKSEADESEDDSSSGEDIDDEAAISVLDRARGEGVASDESSSDSDSDSDSSVNFEEESESEIEIEEGKPEEGDPTSAFAVVNMDWDNLRAVDLMATFVSFVPKDGLIKSVAIYPSEFGKEQMQKEETDGPPRELFRKKSKKKAKDEDSDAEVEIDTSNPADLEKAARQLYQEEEAEDYDSKALRRYQLQRLRYYYAVVRCDSAETAKAIYDSCDGTEFESTANIFDLRYVPEDMDFDESDVKEVCHKIPSNYKPGATFITDALQHSKVKLTWDETPKERLALSSRAFSQKELDDMDFKAYLASDSDDSEVEENAKDKYKNLISSGFKFDGKNKEDDDDVDMEITFNPGLDDKVEEEKSVKEDEDTISAYKRKQKERRKSRLEKFKQLKEQEKADVPEKPTNKKKRQGKQKEHSDEKSQAELELLMMDENDEKPDNHFSMKDIIKAEKRKGKKGKKGKNAEEVSDNFEIDLDDDRFKEVFEDHDYAIDPTSADFKKTSTAKKILEERSKRAGKRKHSKEHKTSKKPRSDAETPEVKSLVKKLKSRHGK